MVDLKTQVQLMAQDIEHIKNEMGEIKQLLKDHIQDEKEVWGRFADSKANVWVEKAISYTLYTVAGIFIFVIVYLILKHGGSVPLTPQ